MAKNLVHMICKPATKEKIMNECREKFIKKNKQFKDIYISQEFMLEFLADFYLNTLVQVTP